MRVMANTSSDISVVLFRRINPEKNEARFYLLLVQPSLLDDYAVLRVWGRIGGHQRQMATPCASAEEAQALARRLIRRRLQHGYQVVFPAGAELLPGE
jgi:predicted DNA-binding WGR domain protein